MKKLELLAPAGNLLKMETAFAYGADAVYLGIPDFSLRVRINDFNLVKIKEAVRSAHRRGKKIYVTVNIFAHNKHLEKLPPYIKKLRALKIDALIVSDPGIISVIKRNWPKAEIHLSTQANCTNYEAVKFWAKQGIKRIILGREVSLKEIKEIHRAAPKMELEYFVHGAMCMAYSGRCFLSKEMLGRSANLGDCAQPCRWQFDVSVKAQGHKEEFDLVSEAHGSYLLNSKDLCLIKYLPDLAKAGVMAYKIEGRAKSAYYLAVICGAYRLAIDQPAKRNYLFKELSQKLVHRGYTTGFFLKQKGEQNTSNSHQTVSFEFCGEVLAQVKGGLLIKVHNSIYSQDKLEIILPGYGIIKLVAQIIDPQTNETLSEAHGGGGGQTVILKTKRAGVPVGAVLRREIK